MASELLVEILSVDETALGKGVDGDGGTGNDPVDGHRLVPVGGGEDQGAATDLDGDLNTSRRCEGCGRRTSPLS